jgi:hypothetical protein
MQHNPSILYFRNALLVLQVLQLSNLLCNKFGFVPASYEVAGSSLRRVAGGAKLQEMDLLVEEEFLDVLVSLARHLPLEDLWQADQRPAHTPVLHQDQSRSALQVGPLPEVCLQNHASKHLRKYFTTGAIKLPAFVTLWLLDGLCRIC